MDENEFSKAFRTLAETPGHFPWQWALYQRFLAGDIPQSCNLPTGLGKTSVIHIWLLALATKPQLLPRRLVNVVNRRTVVDQTTNEVEKLRTNLSKVPEVKTALSKMSAISSDPPLAISTLRGQFADNREWSADPSRPAVICGTVDMIGSRLLFSGYGCGFKTRPLHAGFLGQDALLVHDEAHLEPAFQTLIEAIGIEQKVRDFRPLRVMELTATTRGGQYAFPNDDERKANEINPTVQRRVQAKKTIHSAHPVPTRSAKRKTKKALRFCRKCLYA
jgi:CRISPR-associated endonuclease/helicase Cas3